MSIKGSPVKEFQPTAWGSVNATLVKALRHMYHETPTGGYVVTAVWNVCDLLAWLHAKKIKDHGPWNVP